MKVRQEAEVTMTVATGEMREVVGVFSPLLVTKAGLIRDWTADSG
jgi:hypothetical protein